MAERRVLSSKETRERDAKFPAQTVHLVEFADLRHAVWTWRYGDAVGEDEFGNRYYRTRGGEIDPTLGFERRWVIYNGYTEASAVPPSWHGSLHLTVDVPPTQESYTPRPWQKPHRANMTGTPAAYRPPGSTLAQGRRPEGDRRLQGVEARRLSALPPPHSPC